MSRRAADEALRLSRVWLNGHVAEVGSEVRTNDTVTLDGHKLELKTRSTILLMNKPAGYVCSRNGQGSKTIYELLPQKYNRLKPVGRLDKDTSGLLVLTDDGELANKLTHPRYQKEKIYKLKLNKNLVHDDKNRLLTGVKLSDGLSKFVKVNDCSDGEYEVVLSEGRNRQIRRTFNSLGYKVLELKRTQIGKYILELREGQYAEITD